MNRFTRFTVSALLGLIILVSGTTFAPRPTHAQLLVHDPLNLVQNTITAITNAKVITGPLFWQISQQMLNSIVRSTVNWINSGFNGSPAFVTDLNATMQRSGDTQALAFINQLQSSGSITSPFRDQVAQNVLSNYFLSTSRDGFSLQNQYTLNQASPDPKALEGGSLANGGGLSAWLSLTINPQNNWIGFQDIAQRALLSRVSSAQNTLLTELGWGNGFQSFRGNCANTGSQTSGSTNTVSVTNKVVTTNGTIVDNTPLTQVSNVNLTGTDPCAGQSIKTPGTAIAGAELKVQGIGADSLVNAKEFDEIVNALLSQALNVVAGPNGLLSASQSTSGSQALTNPNTPTNTSSGVAVASALSQIVSAEGTSLQQFKSNWQTILNAANAANTALAASSCVPNAQSIITSQVQPVITQAALEIANATAAIATLQTIQSQIPTANTTANTTVQSAQASASYNAFLSSATTPSGSDISFAQAQAQDSGSSASLTLLTQMNNLAAQAKCN